MGSSFTPIFTAILIIKLFWWSVGGAFLIFVVAVTVFLTSLCLTFLLLLLKHFCTNGFTVLSFLTPRGFFFILSLLHFKFTDLPLSSPFYTHVYYSTFNDQTSSTSKNKSWKKFSPLIVWGDFN